MKTAKSAKLAKVREGLSTGKTRSKNLLCLGVLGGFAFS
jgi:hypothetical protein